MAFRFQNSDLLQGFTVDRYCLLSAGSFPFMIRSKIDWSGRNKIKYTLNVHQMVVHFRPGSIHALFKIIFNKCNTHRIKTIVSDETSGFCPPHLSLLSSQSAACNHFCYWHLHWALSMHLFNKCRLSNHYEPITLLEPCDKATRKIKINRTTSKSLFTNVSRHKTTKQKHIYLRKWL